MDNNQENKKKIFEKKDYNKLIEEFKSKVKDLSNEIIDMPKWGYPIVLGSGIVGFVFGLTVLIWIPGVTIMFLYGGVKIVGFIEEKSLKQIVNIKDKIKEVLNIKIS